MGRRDHREAADSAYQFIRTAQAGDRREPEIVLRRQYPADRAQLLDRSDLPGGHHYSIFGGQLCDFGDLEYRSRRHCDCQRSCG
jgi:hypothetical protein